MLQQNTIIQPSSERDMALNNNIILDYQQNQLENIKATKENIKANWFLKTISNCFNQNTCCKQTKNIQESTIFIKQHWFYPKKQSKKELVWCFRKALTSPFMLHDLSVTEAQWTRFESENEKKLTVHYYSCLADSIDIQDKNIFNGSATVRVILQEAIAFAVDPEWSEPINFEIVSYPKLNWIQRWWSRWQARKGRVKRKNITTQNKSSLNIF